jgi:membrane fusion protein (multidrug efflux system)
MAESDPQFEAPVAVASLDDVVPGITSRKPRVGRLLAMVSVPVLLIGGAIGYYVMSLGTVSTDNAYVQQDKVSVSALVSGNIVDVAVRENQHVKAGDLLFRVDPEPFRIAIAQAEASIAAAQVQVVGLHAEVANKGVDIQGAREDVKFFEDEYQRQAALLARGFSTPARLEAADHNLSDARSRLAQAQSDVQKAEAALATSPIAPGVNPAVLAAQAQKRRAELDLSRSVLRAPVGGVISQADRLQSGQMMTAGLPALSIVVSDKSWVEANFKETDLANMKIGQPAELSFDAYPGMKLRGHVASIGAGTGSEFSVLPAQNANGNWVKVTQRVPVRIAIDDKPARPLIAGLSTHVSIDTRR